MAAWFGAQTKTSSGTQSVIYTACILPLDRIYLNLFLSRGYLFFLGDTDLVIRFNCLVFVARWRTVIEATMIPEDFKTLLLVTVKNRHWRIEI